MSEKPEKPTVGGDGQPRWQPDGARQQFMAKMLEEVGLERVFLAAVTLYRRHQRVSHLPDDQPVMAGGDEIVDFLQWLGLRHLRLLRKIAEDPETSSQMVH